MRHQYVIPKLGQSATEVDVVQWLVDVGDRVMPDTCLIEVESDKLQLQLEAEVTGTVVELLVSEGAVVQIGDPVCVIEVDE